MPSSQRYHRLSGSAAASAFQDAYMPRHVSVVVSELAPHFPKTLEQARQDKYVLPRLVHLRKVGQSCYLKAESHAEYQKAIRSSQSYRGCEDSPVGTVGHYVRALATVSGGGAKGRPAGGHSARHPDVSNAICGYSFSDQTQVWVLVGKDRLLCVKKPEDAMTTPVRYGSIYVQSQEDLTSCKQEVLNQLPTGLKDYTILAYDGSVINSSWRLPSSGMTTSGSSSTSGLSSPTISSPRPTWNEPSSEPTCQKACGPSGALVGSPNGSSALVPEDAAKKSFGPILAMLVIFIVIIAVILWSIHSNKRR